MLLASINTTIIYINAETQRYDQMLCSSNDDSMAKNYRRFIVDNR